MDSAIGAMDGARLRAIFGPVERPTGHQITVGRRLLRMTQADLADQAKVSLSTLRRIEASKEFLADCSERIIEALCGTLKGLGIVFTDADAIPGARLRNLSDSWAADLLDNMSRN